MKLNLTFIRSGICIGIMVLGTAMMPANAQSNVHVHVGLRPPPMRVEYTPAPRAGHVWAAGYWGWNGGAHVWIDGHWENERLGFRYIGASWVIVGGEWEFNPAYWEPMPAVVIAQPAPLVVQQPVVQYVEKPQVVESPAQQDPSYWYYCHNPAGYYPYVQQCPGGWQRVTPTR